MTVRLIAFTLAALSLVNAYSFVRLYSSTYVSSDRSIVGIGNRLPSSIRPAIVTTPMDFKTRFAHDLNCTKSKKVDSIKVNGQWAQLKGRLCGSEKIKLVEITNAGNGFTAAIFNTGSQQYQTDLIQLNPGANKINVKITPNKGPVEEQTLVIDSHSI